MKTNLKKSTFAEIFNEINQLPTDLVLIVIDKKVWSYYQNQFIFDKLIPSKQVLTWVAQEGEESKKFLEFERCTEYFLEKGIHRRAHLVAIGGGALSDFAGLVAACILRGISWSIIPTTLLSMVDASIGGKVAINSRFGKNLVGAFHKPDNIWMNSDFLKTLPEKDIVSGKGEILKYCFLSRPIYDLVMAKQERDIIIEACANYKMDLTEKDFFEENERKVLNLGHSFGHAIERVYSLDHGVAVMWGMELVFRSFCDGRFGTELKNLKQNLGIDPLEHAPWQRAGLHLNRLMSYIRKDKKTISTENLDLILLEDIGRPVVKTISFQEIEEQVKKKTEELERVEH